MSKKLKTKLTKLAREFRLREISIQTDERREYFLRFENGDCVGHYDITLPMTDEAALFQMESVKRIIDHHHDAGWLIAYHHEEMDGFVYSYADGRYAERAVTFQEVAA
ncbi:hypothetical protein [Ruegeria atlantica]|uniref:hypothetical protein n=1 Tax=Ruegeria atlantica TaxID=81569 RepID=UPI001480F9E1|nr:hypothetical protein [Ruegeria atlantica]